jgi:ABC-2 type transport system ATP-binding protein
VSTDGRGVEVAVTDGPTALQNMLSDLRAAEVNLHDAGMRRPTLDDVFLRLTGHKADLTVTDNDTNASGPKLSKRAQAKRAQKRAADADASDVEKVT